VAAGNITKNMKNTATQTQAKIQQQTTKIKGKKGEISARIITNSREKT